MRRDLCAFGVMMMAACSGLVARVPKRDRVIRAPFMRVPIRDMAPQIGSVFGDL